MALLRNLISAEIVRDVATEKWKASPLGDDLYIIRPATYAGYVLGHGAIWQTVLETVRPLKLIAIIVQHCSNTGAKDSTAFDWSFRTYNWFIQYVPYVSYTSSTAQDFIEIFGENYILPAGTHRFAIDVTNNHQIYIALIVKAMETPCDIPLGNRK